MASEPQNNSPPTPHKRSLIPYLGIALILLAAAFGITQVIRSCARAPGEAASSLITNLAAAFKDAYRSDVSVLVHSAVASVSREPKLVVYTVTFTTTAEARKESALWGMLGTTTSRVVALDNRAQYYIPVAQLKPSDFHYDPTGGESGSGVLRVRIPSPILDEGMVVVQSDPSKIIVQTSAGWASLQAFEGRTVEEEAKKQLRVNVVAEARKDVYRAAARENSRTVVADHIYTVLKDRLKNGVRVEVEFQEETTP